MGAEIIILLSASITINLYFIFNYILNKPKFDTIVVLKRAEDGVQLEDVIKTNFGNNDVIAIAKLNGETITCEGFSVLYVNDTSHKS